MIAKDKGRKWMWCFLGALVTLPFYFVQQLVAAFAFFAIGFAAIAFVIVSLYMLQKGWELAVARVFRDASAWNSSGWRASREAAPVVGSIPGKRPRWSAEHTQSAIRQHEDKIDRYLIVAGLKPETSGSSCPERLTAGEGLRVNTV